MLPHALMLIDEFRVLIDRGVELGVLEGAVGDADPIELSLSRTLRWAGGLNGALLVSNAQPDERLVPELLDGRSLALRLAEDLLRGWGASADMLAEATALVDGLAERDRLLVAGATAPLTEAAAV